MAAYIIADVEVSDERQYEQYRKWASMALATHGVRILARGGQTITLEGRPPNRVVLLEFPDLTSAQSFYDSSEYQRARGERVNAAVMNMFVVAGV